MGRICTVKLLSGHNVKIVPKSLSCGPTSQLGHGLYRASSWGLGSSTVFWVWFFSSKESELYKYQDRFTWLLDHLGNGLSKEVPRCSVSTQLCASIWRARKESWPSYRPRVFMATTTWEVFWLKTCILCETAISIFTVDTLEKLEQRCV